MYKNNIVWARRGAALTENWVGYLSPSSGLNRHCMYMEHRHTCRQAVIDIKKNMY